jgi:Transglutaminase-like superfamily
MARARIEELSAAAPKTPLPSPYINCPAAEFRIWRPSNSPRGQALHRAAQIINALLILAVACALVSWFWEYSTQRYVKGFADAIIPASASDEQKVESILDWMSHGPARENAGEDFESSVDRDPTYTLNYTKLLKTCGTATNAFLNLADSGGLRARRLLLLDSQDRTVHVVAEVWLDGEWVVVDPAFRAILRGRSGDPLTRLQLADPVVSADATHELPGYPTEYNYRNTAHVRFARLGAAGSLLGALFVRSMPNIANSPTLSLVLERRSLAVTALCLAIVLLLLSLRVWLLFVQRSGRIRDYAQLVGPSEAASLQDMAGP